MEGWLDDEQKLFILYITDKEISEHEVNKKSSNEELIQIVEKLRNIVNELALNTDSLKNKKFSPPEKSVKQKKQENSNKV